MNDVLEKPTVDTSAPILRRSVPFAMDKSGSNKNFVGYAIGCDDSVYLGLAASAIFAVISLYVMAPIVLHEGLFGPFFISSTDSIPVIWMLPIPVFFVLFCIGLVVVTQIRVQIVVDRDKGKVQFQYGRRRCLPPSEGIIVLTEAILMPSNKRWFQNGRPRAGSSFVFVVAIKGDKECEVIGVSDAYFEEDVLVAAEYAKTLADQLHAETGLPIQVNQNPECTMIDGKGSQTARKQDLVFSDREKNRIWGKLAFKE